MSITNKLIYKTKALLGIKPPPPESSGLYNDVTEDEWKIIHQCRPFTMTSIERLIAAIRAVDHIVMNGIPGDIVECGVWRGGSSMAMALNLIRHGDTSRRLYLYDTFEGMTPPTEEDLDFQNKTAEELLTKDEATFKCDASLEDVTRNMTATGYPMSNITMIKGPVEETIPGTIPEAIALLRLDTDWLESTRHEMKHLFPLLAVEGILIIDDYGHWKGSRQAVDEYIKQHNVRIFLSRVDYTGRIAVKLHA